MPVVLTFDLEAAGTGEHNRIQSLFERLGWENLGGSAYRYPRLGTMDQPVEDWFNHVVPALMLFRAYLRKSNRRLKKFTIDAQSSAGHNPSTGFGEAPLPADAVTFYAPNNKQFALKKLQQWLEDTSFPY